MNRILFLDLARGFTVLFIPAIHTGMVYSDLSVHQSLPGIALIAIAEGPGGQLLMLLMGISFAFKRQHSFKKTVGRVIILLVLGYLLNTLKFIWPYEFGWLPAEVLEELAIESNGHVPLQLFLIGDILHFSALVTMILYLMHRQKNFAKLSFMLAAVIVIISPLLWDIKSAHSMVNYFLSLVGGQPPQVFFPLFPWLVYPLAGLGIGYYLLKNEVKTMRLCAIAGVLLIMIGCVGEVCFPQDHPAGFYRTPAAATSWHLGIVLLALSIWYGVSKWAKDNLFCKLLAFSSKNITTIYLVQWVMICWMLPVAGFRQLNLTYSLIMMAIITGNTYSLVYIIQHFKSSYAKQKNI